MQKIKEILRYTIEFSEDVQISIGAIFSIILSLILVSLIFRLIRKLVNNKLLEEENRGKLRVIFLFLKYVIYVLIITMALESAGIDVTVLLAGSAALLVGLGLGLQTLFQDIISGMFILLDKTLHVNDIVEVDGLVGKVFEIKLRTTRAVTIDNRVVIIPNHKFMTHSLFNWTQNDDKTIETVDVGVAYGSDVEKVKKALMEAAKEHPKVLNKETLNVLFVDFGESSLDFRLIFTTKDSFSHIKIKSDLRYAIEKKFRENNITIPFPQRDIHIKKL